MYQERKTGRAKTESLALKSAVPPEAGGFKVLFYSHDTMGLGHLQRNLKISKILKSVNPGFRITLITGSSLISEFSLPDGIDSIPLPPVRKVGKEKYDSYYPGESFDRVLARRKKLILDSVKELSPDIFWVDHAPIGMKGELLPALDWINNNKPSILRILGLRDIIDDPLNVIPLWQEQGILDILRGRYNRILVYGDRTVYDPVREYELTPDIVNKTSYTGYVMNISEIAQPDTTGTETTGKQRIFVTLGGGEWAGETIIGNLLKAVEESKRDFPFDLTIVTGPFLPEKLWTRYSGQAGKLGVKMHKFIMDIRPFIAASDLVISTAGYNTVTDVLGYGKRALFIPRIKFRKEQYLRSSRFAEQGIVDMIHPDRITPELLIAKISEMLECGAKPVESARSKGLININGAGFLSVYASDIINAKRR